MTTFVDELYDLQNGYATPKWFLAWKDKNSDTIKNACREAAKNKVSITEVTIEPFPFDCENMHFITSVIEYELKKQLGFSKVTARFIGYRHGETLEEIVKSFDVKLELDWTKQKHY
jgi:hypothetical protein